MKRKFDSKEDKTSDENKEKKPVRIVLSEIEHDADLNGDLGYPALTLVEIPAEKLRPADLRLIQAAATYPSTPHRGPHSGAVSSLIARRYSEFVREIKESSEWPKHEKTSDYLIHALCFDPDDEDDLSEYIEYVHAKVAGTDSEEEDTEPDGSVHPENRIGFVDDESPEWTGFQLFWTSFSADQIYDMTAWRGLDELTDNNFFVDVSERYDVDEKPTSVRVMKLPVMHTFRSVDRTGDYEDASYVGIAELEHQHEWTSFLKSDFDCVEADEEITLDHPEQHDWQCDTHDDPLFCHDQATYVNLYYEPGKCPPVGTYVALQSVESGTDSVKVIHFGVREDGIYQGSERIRLLSEWDAWDVVVVYSQN